MNIVLSSAKFRLPEPDWHDSKSYLWITKLPRRAIAWEFLRRSPDYRAAFASEGKAKPSDPVRYPLVRLRGS